MTSNADLCHPRTENRPGFFRRAAAQTVCRYRAGYYASEAGLWWGLPYAVSGPVAADSAHAWCRGQPHLRELQIMVGRLVQETRLFLSPRHQASSIEHKYTAFVSRGFYAVPQVGNFKQVFMHCFIVHLAISSKQCQVSVFRHQGHTRPAFLNAANKGIFNGIDQSA